MTTPHERMKFEIDNVTGVITTLHILDRDEPDREKEAYLTVMASDNGRPQLDDVCTFKITIEDINDNTPFFDKVVRRLTSRVTDSLIYSLIDSSFSRLPTDDDSVVCAKKISDACGTNTRLCIMHTQLSGCNSYVTSLYSVKDIYRSL